VEIGSDLRGCRAGAVPQIDRITVVTDLIRLARRSFSGGGDLGAEEDRTDSGSRIVLALLGLPG